MDPVKEEPPKETTKPSAAEGEQQKDAGKDEATPKATSEAEATGGAAQQKERDTKSSSPAPDLGKR